MLKVLIVEDDHVIANLLEEILVDAGYQVCGIASTVAEAIKIGERHTPDLGVIDLCLRNGGCGTGIAAALRRRGPIGVLYATGSPGHPCLARAEGEGCIAKPYSACDVVSALRVVRERMFNQSLSVFPHGFKLLRSPSANRAA